jgi:hypothetical protein
MKQARNSNTSLLKSMVRNIQLPNFPLKLIPYLLKDQFALHLNNFTNMMSAKFQNKTALLCFSRLKLEINDLICLFYKKKKE